MTRVKICGITREEDAKQAVRPWAQMPWAWCFLCQKPTFCQRRASSGHAAHIPAFTSIVGLFVNASVAEVEAVLAQVPLDILQFHGDESTDYYP